MRHSGALVVAALFCALAMGCTSASAPLDTCTSEAPCTADAAPLPGAISSPVVRTSIFEDSRPPYDDHLESHLKLTLDVDANVAILSEVRITKLPPNEVVSLWWAVMNNPEHCIAGEAGRGLYGSQCGSVDFTGGVYDGQMTDPAAVSGAMLYAAPAPTGGMITDANGLADFGDLSFSLAAISPDAPASSDKALGEGNGLNDLVGAEIHILVQKHGAPLADPELLGSQLSNFLGGCLLGEPYANMDPPICVNPQIAVFQRPVIP